MAQCHKRAFVTPPCQGRRIHMDRSVVDQKLVRRPPCSGVTAGAGWHRHIIAVSDLPSHTVHFSAAAYRADLRAAGDRGPVPGGSGVPVPGGRLRHLDGHRQAPARRWCSPSASGVFEGDVFSNHSGRVGLARMMSGAGTPTETTMRQGRWKSAETVRRYTRAKTAGASLQWMDGGIETKS